MRIASPGALALCGPWRSGCEYWKEEGAFMRMWLVIVALGLLLGCSPEYNWRQMDVAGGMVQALFPDRPDVVRRTLKFAGQDVDFTMTAATVNGAVFAVGYAKLPEALVRDAAGRVRMGQTVVASFYQNLGVDVPDQLPAFGRPFDITGRPDGKKTMRLRAVTWVLPHALVEGIVTARADEFPESQAKEFLQGLKVGDQ